MLNVISLLIPVFLFLVAIEWYISYKRGDQNYTTGNTVMNMTIGAIDQVGSLIYFVLLFLVLEYVYTHFRLFEMENNWYQWVLAYIVVDFLSYWYHRFSHEVNILWAGHVTHHSSEFFNFSNGFRTSLFQAVNRIAFWAILPVFGFSPVVLVFTLKISGIYCFFLHTQYVRKLGFLEKIMVTPSLHRVHHGKNDLYINKNYGSTFIIWDKLFGTYQEETETVKYGITSPYVDNDPLLAIGHHYLYLWKTMKAIPHWPTKIKLLFMSPDWHPEQLKKIDPLPVGNKLPVSSAYRQYAYFQISCGVVGMISMLVYRDFISTWEIVLCSGIFVFCMSNATMIFNNNLKVGFAKRELLRLTLAAFFVLLTLLEYPKNYLWGILAFLLISLGLMLSLSKTTVHLSRKA